MCMTKKRQERIFPTHVGVSLSEYHGEGTPDDFPHACGGEPPDLTKGSVTEQFSPRMWG